MNFVVDDMTDLQRTRGPFDFLLKGERPTTSSSREVAAARTLKLIDTVACPVPTPFLSPSEKRVAREASRSRDRAIANAMRAGWAADNADAFNWPYEAASVYPEPYTELFRLSAWRTVPSANSPKSRKSIQRRSETTPTYGPGRPDLPHMARVSSGWLSRRPMREQPGCARRLSVDAEAFTVKMSPSRLQDG